MSISVKTLEPLTFSAWQTQQSYSDIHGVSETAYVQYLKEWYAEKYKVSADNRESLKQEYIQLLKDLNFLFSQNESDLFIKDINYDNPEDLILAIPFFAKKLKEVAKILNFKRESVKRAKSKYNLIGSNTGLEALLYDYVLRTFTQKEGYSSQLPVLSLQTHFPELSAVKNDFFIELEELHDPHSYHDSDPSVDVKNYTDYSHLQSYIPLSDGTEPFSEKEIIEILSTRFLSRAAPSTLFNLFNDYLANLSESPSLSANLKSQFDNQVVATEKYLGETIYGLTAVRLDQIAKPDYVLQLDFREGNNWFLWPSGHYQLNNNVYNNFYYPILINDSNLVYSGATPGTSPYNSDLIFSDKNGIVEGAWLQGPYEYPSKGNVKINLKGGNSIEFLFPYVGYNITPRSLEFDSFSLERTNEKLFNALTTKQQENILSKYYTGIFPLSSSESLYLNQTTLIDQGATAASFSDEADLIIKRPRTMDVPILYADQTFVDTEMAYVYKFNRTDLPITYGSNTIHWPVEVVKSTENVPSVFTQNDCLPIRLIEINSQYAMTGAVAGQDFETSDVIYKLNNKGDVTQPIEAAWYGSEPLSHININYKNISIYGKMSAVECSHRIEGTIQSSCSFIAQPGSKISFVWCGEDTFADEVFQYYKHEDYCEYGKTYPHEYYKNQDYVNPLSVSNRNYWTKCTCRSVNYSPIGHAGNKVTDYNGLTDCLFADPAGLGDQFTLDSWRDTRGMNYKNSPQFAFFCLNRQEGDGSVGFGTGRWKTSDNKLSSVGDRMILKAGRRYTYYRSSLRTDSNSGAGNTISNSPVPYFVSNYAYKKINAVMCDPGSIKYDIVIAVDCSRSQTFAFEQIKKAVGNICKRLINVCDSRSSESVRCYDRSKQVQVGLIGFAGDNFVVNNLTNGEYELNLQANAMSMPQGFPNHMTDISSALKLADFLLNTNLSSGNRPGLELKSLCSKLNATLIEQSSISKFLNVPQSGAKQKIVLISDGAANLNQVTISDTVQSLKDKNIEIFAIDMGELSITNDVMEQIATSDQTYFSLYKYLVSGDGDYDQFVDYISTRIGGCVPFHPVWRKAVRSFDGGWTGTSEVSEMVLRPGDFLSYNHQNSSTYTDKFTNKSYTQPSVSFTINVKLDGWDYETSSFSVLNIGKNYGAKPYWAVVPNNPIPYAGQIRFAHDYVPVHQPDVSRMVLNNADYVQYNRYGDLDLKWEQPLNFSSTINTVVWNKIKFNKKYSNLENLLKTNKLDYIADGSFEPSDMILESYSEYKPARYHYYSNNSFIYTENLFLRSRCNSNYTIFLTGSVVEPSEPYANMVNRFYPTIATVSFPEFAVSERQVGGYLLPENLGTPTYRGKGYSYSLNKNALSSIDALSGEHLYLDPSIYGARNRGLTQKDQLSPLTLNSIDNKWMMEPYGAGAKAGVLLTTKENQKFTPYQSNYEILGYNNHGLARQSDNFQFWNLSEEGIKWNETAPTNSRKEILGNVFSDRLTKLLANKGTMVQWRCDLFGNDYGLYKQLPSEMLDLKTLPRIPTIIYQSPSAVEIDLGTYNILTVTVEGDEPFSYQWYKDNRKLSGGAQSIFSIYKSTQQTSGSYVCVISNLVGVISSKPIEVYFNPNLVGNFIDSEFGEILIDDESKPISWF